MEYIEKRRLSPISQAQKDVLIEFIKKHPHLQTGRFSPQFTFKTAQKLWEEIAGNLNSIAGGATKDWRQWRKTWQDLKKNTKTKAVATKKYSCGTGGGGPPKLLNNSESEIYEMISPSILEGITGVQESTVNFTFDGDDCMSSFPDKTVVLETESREADVIINDVIEHTEISSNKEKDVDHNYNLQDLSGLSQNKTQKQRLTKCKRLENSLKLSQQLVKVVDEKKEIIEHYYNEKIEYLKWRRNYENKKLQILEKSLEVEEKILMTLKDIKGALTS